MLRLSGKLQTKMASPHPCSHNSNEPAEINGDPIYQVQRRLKVVVVGAGASGLLLAYKLQRHFDEVDVTVFEKNAAVSGTWFENVR